MIFFKLIFYGSIKKNCNNKIGAQTREDGKFVIKPLPVGTYVLYTMTLDGKEQAILQNIIVKTNNITFTKEVFAPSMFLPDFECFTYTIKLINPEETSLIVMDAKMIEESAGKRDIFSMVTSMNSAIKRDQNDNLSLRGGRPTDMLVIVDGVKMRGLPNLPAASYESISAYLGGLPAKYGDTTGGAIVIESKSYFDYYRQWKAQQEAKN